jgi:D-3-phosphoglycerate dehydrogenase
MKILVVGDSYMPAGVFERALAGSGHEVTALQLDEDARFGPETPGERGLREYVGHPRQIAARLGDHEALLFHVAPITDALLAAGPRLALLGCARGGPVNVDVAAATRRGLPVAITPGKNAEAVADLVIGFMLMLARGIGRAQRFILDGGVVGASVVEGAQFFGRDLGGQTLGLVGFGQVGRRVARRALGFGMRVRAFDPFVPTGEVAAAGAEACALDALVASSDFVSLHARGTRDNEDMFAREAFRRMKRGAFFVNTARDSLVDEEALHEALVAGHLGGAALDLVRPRPAGAPSPLLALPNVIITPHIGGSTHETVQRGAEMLAGELARFAAGQPLHHLANPEVLRR